MRQGEMARTPTPALPLKEGEGEVLRPPPPAGEGRGGGLLRLAIATIGLILLWYAVVWAAARLGSRASPVMERMRRMVVSCCLG